MTEITGQCLCGAVRFSFSELPLTTRLCWCRDCQYLAAGNATVNAIFKTATFTVTGETRGYEGRANSGSLMRRSFCVTCGTALFSQAASRPHLIVVRTGALDDPDLARPESVIWTKAAPAWVCFDPNLPMVEAQPAPLPSS